MCTYKRTCTHIHILRPPHEMRYVQHAKKGRALIGRLTLFRLPVGGKSTEKGREEMEAEMEDAPSETAVFP
jgi:hypothetical protein